MISKMLLVGVLINFFGCSTPNERLELHEEAVLLKEPSLQNLADETMHIVLLPKGSNLIVLGKDYGKDYLAYKVQTADGYKGYVLHSATMNLVNQGEP